MTIETIASPKRANPSSSRLDDSPSQATFSRANAAWHIPSAAELLQNDFLVRLANDLDERLGCAVWLSRLNARGRIVEDAASRTAQAMLIPSMSLEAIAADASQTSGPISAGCPASLPTSPSAIMERVWMAQPGTSSLSISLPMEACDGCWSITIAWREVDGETKNAIEHAAWLDLHAKSLAQSLEVWTMHGQGRRYQAWLRCWARVRSFKSLWLLTAAIGLALTMAIPISYRPKRDCIIEPSSRRYVASPIEGRLKSIEVRPGEQVIQGQLLGRIDDTQLLRELAIAEAELQTQTKKHDVALANRAAGDLRLSQLECQLAELKIDSLTDQLQRLEILSPCDGVIVQGDWFGNENMPVSFGQTLFEISPLDRMTAEVHLKAEDLPWVRVGSSAVLRTDSSMNRSWPGNLERLEPHAEVIDDEAVYIAEMEIKNADNAFRPGMKAQVVVDQGQKSIGWILFRKPYQWLLNQWVW